MTDHDDTTDRDTAPVLTALDPWGPATTAERAYDPYLHDLARNAAADWAQHEARMQTAAAAWSGWAARLDELTAAMPPRPIGPDPADDEVLWRDAGPGSITVRGLREALERVLADADALAGAAARRAQACDHARGVAQDELDEHTAAAAQLIAAGAATGDDIERRWAERVTPLLATRAELVGRRDLPYSISWAVAFGPDGLGVDDLLVVRVRIAAALGVPDAALRVERDDVDTARAQLTVLLGEIAEASS